MNNYEHLYNPPMHSNEQHLYQQEEQGEWNPSHSEVRVKLFSPRNFRDFDSDSYNDVEHGIRVLYTSPENGVEDERKRGNTKLHQQDEMLMRQMGDESRKGYGEAEEEDGNNDTETYF